MSDNKNGMNSAIVARIRSVLDEVKSAAVDTLDSMPSTTGRRPTDLAKNLGIDMKLAWKLGHLLRATTPGEILHSIAGAAGIKKTLVGIQTAGADAQNIKRLQSAFDALLLMIKEVAGDRGSFETLVTGMGEAESLQLSVDMRRKYFSAVCSMIGVQCATQYRMVCVGPSSDSDAYSVAAVHSWADLKQFTLHGGVMFHTPTELSRCRCCTFSSVENLDPAVGGEIPLLPDFSRMEQITLEGIHSTDGDVRRFHRVDTNLGLASSADLTLGQLANSLTPLALDGDSFFQDCVELRVPCKELVLDFLIAPGLMKELSEPQIRMHSLWSDPENPAPGDDSELPIEFKVTKLRSGELPEPAPQGWSRAHYASLLSLVGTRTNWPLDAFDHFRIHLSFPFMPSKLQTLIQLKPNAR